MNTQKNSCQCSMMKKECSEIQKNHIEFDKIACKILTCVSKPDKLWKRPLLTAKSFIKLENEKLTNKRLSKDN